MWYKLIRIIFDRYESRLKKDISKEVVDLFSKCKIDLYEVRFNKCVLSTEQVDEVLGYGTKIWTGASDPARRIFYKNVLLQAKVMEEGYVKLSEEDSRLLGIPHQDYPQQKIWKHNPTIPNLAYQEYKNMITCEDNELLDQDQAVGVESDEQEN
jgi:hypothetical protein